MCASVHAHTHLLQAKAGKCVWFCVHTNVQACSSIHRRVLGAPQWVVLSWKAKAHFPPSPSPRPPISHSAGAYSPLPVCTEELEAFAEPDSLGCLTHKPADFLSNAPVCQMVIMGRPQCCRQVGVWEGGLRGRLHSKDRLKAVSEGWGRASPS